MSDGAVMQFRGSRVLGLSELTSQQEMNEIVELEQVCSSVVHSERVKVVGSVISEVSVPWSAAVTDLLTMKATTSNEIVFRLEDVLYKTHTFMLLQSNNLNFHIVTTDSNNSSTNSINYNSRGSINILHITLQHVVVTIHIVTSAAVHTLTTNTNNRSSEGRNTHLTPSK